MTPILKATRLDTPLGAMLAIADEKALYLLEFVDQPCLESEVEQLKRKTKSTIILETAVGPCKKVQDSGSKDCAFLPASTAVSRIIPGSNNPIVSVAKELDQYFNGKLGEFKTPVFYFGSPFQKHVWEELQKIPIGETRSYADIAHAIGSPTSHRAVARANGANQIAIIIPCHRVIYSNGELGGYSGGIFRKKWLIGHEKMLK